MDYVTLNNGVKMPLEGFGVFQVPDPAQCEQAVRDAIDTGYRLIDTAAAYMNEQAVDTAIAKCNVPREALFITTKLWVQDAGYEAAKKAIQTSLSNLGLDYLDLYLVHQPVGDELKNAQQAYHAIFEMADLEIKMGQQKESSWGTLGGIAAGVTGSTAVGAAVAADTMRKNSGVRKNNEAIKQAVFQSYPQGGLCTAQYQYCEGKKRSYSETGRSDSNPVDRGQTCGGIDGGPYR